ncbi:MAG: 50S ribosomal protein L7/L12 [Candidatus Babeliaceae bacterium]|nr:50S ribosomal protein L7/L12 [Candidatus Babeliaceae bacterium]
MSKSMENLVKEISGLTVLELAELTKALESAFGVSAAMPMAAAMPTAAGEAPAGKKEEEKTEFKVELVDSGANKINVIKALRQVKKDLGLTEAKKMAEETPSVIAEAASKDEAKVMKETLEAAGAKVKLS